MTQMRRILFATDFSKASAKAFATALALAQTNRAVITILHVITPFGGWGTEESLQGRTLDLISAETRRWSQRQLTKLTEKARKAGIRAVGVVVEGDAGPQIVRAARSKRADLVVVGTHGRTGLVRFFVGSVAQRVVATAPCPVMVVRGR